MTDIQLLKSATVVLDGAGNGTCPPLGPSSYGETWSVTLISVQCSSNASEAIASVYLSGALLGTTTWGSTGDSDTGIIQQVMTGQQLTAAWSGGDPGATATMTVMGTRTVS
jgi:hypothetical protein